MELSLEQIYLYMGVFATVLFVLKMGMFMLLGGDVELLADFDSISETDTSFNFLSVQSLLAFFMSFSWMGLTAVTKMNTTPIISALVAAVVGLIFMTVTAYLMFLIRKLDKKIVVKLEECEGKEAKTYTEFQPKGEGQVQLNVNKKLVTINATSLCDEKINSFTLVRVEKVENNKLYINKI